MLARPLHSTPTTSASLALAQTYLDAGRHHKAAENLDVAFILYDQAKVTFRQAADAYQVTPLLSQLKSALANAQTSQTPEEKALRERIAEVYFERAELLEKLGKPAKAQASYKKAQAWGYEETKSATTMPVMSLFTSSAPAVTQTAISAASLSAQQKSALVDYLFEKALLTLSALEVSNKPSLFLVYAHDNFAHGKAEASTSKYLINKLSKIQVNLYSDQTPMGKKYSDSPEALKKDGKLEDILTNQLCLLPTQLRDDVKPVNKVVVCCSEVLGSYLKWPDYDRFYQELRAAYLKDREQPANAEIPEIREVVRKFSQEENYKAEFHHVLTEMAFLQIRAEYLKDHGIIPVSLTQGSYDQCLAKFISATIVRMEDCLRFEAQAQTGREVYSNQSRQGVLFKLIERLLVSSDEAKTFLDKFWDGHGNFIARLKKELPLGHLEFAQLIDGIFDDIRTALHSQLASTVQQQHHQLWVLNADPRTTLEAQYFAALKQDEAFKETQQLYIEPRGKASLDGKAETFDLLSKVKALIKDKHVVLLTGDSGAGKSTLNRVLEKHLWENKKAHDAIPLFISLPSIDKPEHDLIGKALKKRGLSEFQIQKLKQEKQKFVFILDGYDEIRQTRNLYLSNHINQPDGWQGPMITSCRSEYLGWDYQSRFQPNPPRQGEDPSFQEVVIAPFSEKERKQYLEKYVQHNSMGWAVQQYQEALAQPHLKDLASNPFLLRVVLEALPYLENEGKVRTAIQLRIDLYDQFVKQWFERNQRRLSTQNLAETKREIFREWSDDGFTEHGIELVRDLAVHLYTENAGNPVIEYSLRKDKGSWKDTFFGKEEEKQLLREAWPLIRNGNQYRFIHKSLLEYCVARSLFDSFDACLAPKTRPRRGSDASVYSFEDQSVLPSQRRQDLSLAPKHWVGDLGVVGWLTERVQQEPSFKDQLSAIIERSKTDKAVRQTAANAMTVLVRAGIRFNGDDLKGIRIPGADLSHGVFDSVQLQEADLRKAKLHQIWLRQANLSGAQMAGVQFGEWPYLAEESPVYSCVYSPDGKACAVGLRNGRISVYETSDWKKILTLSGHTGSVRSITYSPQGDQLASGSYDKTVRLWDAKTGALLHKLSDHVDWVTGVAYSPQGNQLASGSYDQTIRLWDIKTGKLLRTLSGHIDDVTGVAYSPQGDQLASVGRDNTVRLWVVKTGNCLRTLIGHTDLVWSVVYSPLGDQLASSGRDGTIRLWDAKTGVLHHTLNGHMGGVTSVVYSPQGDQLASGSRDNTVRLWDAKTGVLCHTIKGHIDAVQNVAYSPQGDQLASGSHDRTVRLWDVKTGALLHNLSSHTNVIQSAAYSLQEDQLALGSHDHTVRLWDVKTGDCLSTLRGHKSEVASVAYSPQGDQLASGSYDQTIRLWDIKKGKLLHTLTGHIDEITSVAYSPQGDQLASGSLDNTVRFWDVKAGTPIFALKSRMGGVTSVVYSPQGDQLALGNLDNTVRLWGLEKGDNLRTLSGHKASVWSVAYSPQGDQLASGSYDFTVRLWNVKTGTCLCILDGHTDWVKSVAYSPQGDQLASGGLDGTVQLWDVKAEQNKSVNVIRGFGGAVTSIAWKEKSNSNYLVTCSEDRAVRQWEVKKEGEEHKVILRWSSAHEVLTVTGAVIEGVGGLNGINEQLLRQRGAVGEPFSPPTQERPSKAELSPILEELPSRPELPPRPELSPRLRPDATSTPARWAVGAGPHRYYPYSSGN
ncbi:NACHT domain-containing protein [Mycoavidus sp. HKI]|uniref:WD40 domain-containing protein n=1 Tax=Mycoavidus sp. HKI TaxID=2840467 RepID=UPI001CBEA94B|nr:NACHT domain-containing protein [Mycoavidus sp. HKI]UAW63664.1 NACHT domain-containing protein [Mycoavidus sp. HKI]